MSRIKELFEDYKAYAIETIKQNRAGDMLKAYKKIELYDFQLVEKPNGEYVITFMVCGYLYTFIGIMKGEVGKDHFALEEQGDWKMSRFYYDTYIDMIEAR